MEKVQRRASLSGLEVRVLVKELKGNPLSPWGWNAKGDVKTAAKAVENAITPLPARPFSGAIDNPAAESF